jgi:putative transposase
MSRYPRPVFENIPLHIVQRGNNRNPCFFCKGDYQVYLGMMKDALDKFECTLHAYVLMPNHVHLLASPKKTTAPAELMKRVGQRYVQYVNRRYKRFGTLWQGRYHSSLIDTDRYFLACQRYIELNPVRAGLVAHPVDFEWSSYRAHAHGAGSEIVVPHDIYTSLGAQRDDRQACYRALFSEALSTNVLEEIRQATKSTGSYGSVGFSEKFSVALGRDLARQVAGRRCS